MDDDKVANEEAMSSAVESLEMDPLENEADNETTRGGRRAFALVLELSDEELARVDEHIRNKIVKNCDGFLQKHDQLRASYEKFKIEYEQRFIELEAEFTDCQSRLEAESKNSHLFRLKANENDELVSSLQKRNKILSDDKETLISHEQRLSTTIQNLEAEKRELHLILDKRLKENDRLNDEWKSMNTKLSESESRVCELTAKLEEALGKESMIGFKEKQFQTDRQRLLNEIEWLNNELQKKSVQVVQFKSEHSQKAYEAECQLEQLTADNRKMKSQVENLQLANHTLEAQLEELTDKLQESREKLIQTQSDYAEESQTREKLIELYKEESAGCQEKLRDAASAIQDLKKMSEEMRDEYTVLLDQKNRNESAFEARVKANEETINRLEQELKNANELLSIAKRKGATVLSEADIEQLSPAAAVASRLLKSGMTLTQIYSEYVNLSESLQSEKAENGRLKAYISELVREIEEKAPVLRRQKQEYEEIMKTCESLTTQLENAMMDYEALKSKSEDVLKKHAIVASENMRLRQDVADLSRQVTILLHEVEKARAKSFDAFKAEPGKYSNEKECITEVSSSSGESAAARSALDFRNIEELQQKYQKLMRMVHEMSDKKQSEERAELELRTKEYNEKVNMAMRELEELRNQREKQEQVLEEIRKQRDTYKQLLAHQQEGGMRSGPLFTSTPSANRSKTDELPQQTSNTDEQSRSRELELALAEKNAALQKLQQKFDKFENEMILTNKMLREELDKSQTNISELTMKLAFAESKLENALEKCKTLSTSAEKQRREVEASKERAAKFSELVIKHEQSLNLNMHELFRAKERVSEVEARLHSVSVERDMLKSSHERLSKEHAVLVVENANRNSILANLDLIKNGLERNERETKVIYAAKCEQLERDNSTQRKQIEQEHEKHAVIVKSWQSQCEQLNSQIEREIGEHKKTSRERDLIEAELVDAKKKILELEARLHSSEMLVQLSRNTKSSSAISRLTHLEEESKELSMKLSLADKEIVGLKIQLEESRAHTKQYKSIAESMEREVRESSEANERTRQVLESRISSLDSDLARVKVEYAATLEAKASLESCLTSEKLNFESKLSLLEEEKKKLSGELKILSSRLESTEHMLNERTKHRDEHVGKINVLEEQLRQSEERVAGLDKELAESGQRREEVERQLEMVSAQVEQEKRRREEIETEKANVESTLMNSIEELRGENENVSSQNRLLQQELSRLSQDLMVLQRQDAFRPMGDSESAMQSSVETPQSTQLLEINRYLRSQKDQIEEKYESLKLSYEIEHQRLKSLEGELELERTEAQKLSMQLSQAKMTAEAGNKGDESISLMLDTNRRLKKRKRVALDISQKLEIIEKYNGGTKPKELAALSKQ